MTEDVLLKQEIGISVAVQLEPGEYPEMSDRIIAGRLAKQTISIEAREAVKKVLDSINNDPETSEHINYLYELYNISEKEWDLYLLYKESQVFGISHLQPYDYNVNPRDIGKPSIKKGTPVVCFDYPAKRYIIL